MDFHEDTDISKLGWLYIYISHLFSYFINKIGCECVCMFRIQISRREAIFFTTQ